MTESTEQDNSNSNNIYSDNLEVNLRNSIRNLEMHPAKNIIITISELLNNMCKENNSPEINNKNIALNKKIRYFMLKKVPSISVQDYLYRLTKYSKICESTLVMILIYIDRMCHKYNFKITYYNIYKLMLAAMVLAIKYNEDEFYDNKYYAEIAGITPSELINIEYMFFCICNFNLYVDDDTFNNYSQYLTNFNK
jgi:hypothetical protein